jgi:Protein of unknown function (DUF2924)
MTTKTISEEIAELRAMDVPSLVARYEAVFGRAPRVKHREWLWKRIAWKIQEKRFGGLSEVAKRRLDELIAEIDLPLGEATRTVTGRLASAAKRCQPAVGTTITREWRGREICVRVLENGFEHDGVVYRSLSAVACAITQSHWNGRLFFGLSKERNR